MGLPTSATMARDHESLSDADVVDAASPSANNNRSARLFIKEMVMENFKSYAGEQRVGPFHKCFSAVVGPNGSGKSNVIDAMLFVFGKRAKQMRLNKVSELIHNSSNHQDLDKARVSVHFQEILDLDDETFEAVPGTDFVVTRVAFRDNSSKYYINDRSSTFTEVTKKLRAKGVDLDNNRFLILQGEVEQISLMKPKAHGSDEGFLEYLEDIIGSNVHVEKIETISKQLDEVNEKRVNIVQRVKAAEKEKDGLEGAKNDAENFMLKEAELLKWQKNAAELSFEETKEETLKLKETVAQLELNFKKHREERERHSKEMKEFESQYNSRLKHKEDVEADLRSTSEKFKKFERQDLKYREDLKHLKQKLKKFEEKIQKDTAKVEELERDTEEAIAGIPILEEDIVKLTQQFSTEEAMLEKIREQSKGEVEKYREQLASVRLELGPWEKQLIECQSKIDVASSEAKIFKQKHQAGRKAYQDAQQSLENIKQKIRDKENQLKDATAASNKNKHIAASSQEEEQTCLHEEETLSAKAQVAQLRVSELQGLLESEKSQGNVLKTIMHAKDTKLIEGIFGRLGDLGAIDAKYDIAISTACGGLDFIAVETTSTAQACVELLRSKGAGVATFLILDKQKDLVQKMKRPVSTPEGVPRLFDLVRIRDEKIRVGFYYALGDTVVATNLDQATRIAYGPDQNFRRVVTLDGALFERSGTMSGGGAKPKGGRMGTAIREGSVSIEALESAKVDHNRLAGQLLAVRNQMSLAVSRRNAAEKALTQLEVDIAKTRMEVEALKSQHNDTHQQLDVLKSNSEPAADELKVLQKLEEGIAVDEKELAALKKSSAKLHAKAKDLQEKMEYAGGAKLKQQKAIVDKLQQEIDSKTTAINQKKVAITTNTKKIESLKKSTEQTINEKERGLAEKEKKAAEFKEVEEKAFAIKEEFLVLQQKCNEQSEEVEKTKIAHKDLMKIVNDLRTGEVDAEAKLDDTKRQAEEKGSHADLLIKKAKEYGCQLDKHIEQINKEGINPDGIRTALELPKGCTLQSARQNIALLLAQMKEMSPNLDAIVEYREKAALYNERVNELNAITEDRDDLKKQHDELRKKRLDDFMAGFNSVSLKLKEMYQMITLGGDAELELVDSLDPFAEGVVFSVRPPKKSWKNIANLSGGEKTLSSLALVFALHHYKPTPLYVMDEIDAALDFKNVSIVGHYIKDRTKDAQFVIISLRNNMFELADRLVGIYKTDNCTKSITINPRSFAVNGC